MSRIQTAAWIAVLAWAASAGIAEAQVGVGSGGSGGSTSTTVTTSAPVITPYRAFNFLDSIGVNVQLTFGGAGGANWDNTTGATNPNTGSAWASAQAKIAYELNYGGFRHIRQGGLEGRTDVVADINYFFAQYGITALIVQQVDSNVPNISEDMTMMRTVTPGAIEAYSGTNEWPSNYTKLTYNGTDYYSNGNSSGRSNTPNLNWGPIDNMVSIAALRSNVETANTLYIAASPANLSGAYPWTEPYVDGMDWHVYANEGIQLSPNISGAVPLARAGSPRAKRVFITETGCTDQANSGAGYGDCGNAHTQAVSIVNAEMTAYNVGGADTQSFIYELMNDVTDPSGGPYNVEHNFGLFNGDGSPKTSGAAVHNMTTILADTGTNPSGFQVAAVPFVVTGLPSGGSKMLLQKANGTYELLLWNGNATIFNGTSNEVTPATTSVNIAFGSSQTTVKIYDPITGSSATSTSSNVSSITVPLAADPKIVEITP